jgi:peptidoglycan/xylan/chitin deacetylase (PgdA/CDA1 family)
MSATPGVAKGSAVGIALRTIKLGISAVYFVLFLGWNRFSRMLGKKPRGTCVVLYYHSVPRRYQRSFERQVTMVASKAKPIALSNLNHLPENTHSVAITFDDGLGSFAENAVPVLRKHNVPATVFIVTDALGCRPAWGESYYDSDERVMSDEQVRGLPELISVGSHTLTHPDLLAVSEESAALEITQSRKKLEALLRRPITTFSFPHGRFSGSTVRQCREAGYERVFTTEPVLLSGLQSKFVIGRVAADPWDSGLEFKLKIAGAYCWQTGARTLRSKLMGLFSRTKRYPEVPKSEKNGLHQQRQPG